MTLPCEIEPGLTVLVCRNQTRHDIVPWSRQRGNPRVSIDDGRLDCFDDNEVLPVLFATDVGKPPGSRRSLAMLPFSYHAAVAVVLVAIP